MKPCRLRGLALLLVAFAGSVSGVERVLEFHSDIRIAANGELTVTERIAVQAEGRQIRRGILRDFPTRYRDRAGAPVSVPFSVSAVTRDGKPEHYQLESLENGVRIRIGERDRLLPQGLHEYQITYRTARQLGFFEDHDELYWNVNGNGWTFPFDSLSAAVSLPKAVPAGELRLEAYTGYAGARERKYEAAAHDGGAEFRTTRPLMSEQGMTIVVAFPKGVVAAPAAHVRALWWLRDNPGALAGAAGLLVLIAFLYWRWSQVGRDPPTGPLFPRYEAPARIGAAGVRLIDRMKYDERCFAAGLLDLGARGFVRIADCDGHYEVSRLDGKGELLDQDKALLVWLFPHGARHTVIGKQHDPVVRIANTAFAAALKLRFDNRFFSQNRGSLFLGFLLATLAAVAMVWLGTPPGVFAGVAGAMLVVLFLFARWLPAYSVEGRKIEDGIAGLRQYLGVAEKDDLARMRSPAQTPEEFAKFLPYAVALDVEKTWADRFAAVLGASAVAAAVSDYYQSDSSSGGFFDRSGVGGFTGSLSKLGETVSAASTPPGSSSGFSSGGGGGGFSGGGSSGGGGGGGGGSGW